MKINQPIAWSKIDALYISVLFFTILFTLGPSLDIGGFWWTDESRHAMDGVYILDVLRDRPFFNLYEYTVQYFARYPALGLTWYPPFFAFVESLVFAVFGISEYSARLTVMLFGITGLAAWYIWVRQIWGRQIALFSGLLILTNPVLLLWSRSVMLELPAVSMIILSLLSLHHYLQRPTHLRSIATGLLIAAMLLTKQTTGFILPVMLLYPLLLGSMKPMIVRQSLWAYVIVLVTLVALGIHAVKFGSIGLGAALGDLQEELGAAPRMSLERWLLYTEVILDTYPGIILVMCLAGLLAMMQKPRMHEDLLVLAWIISWYVIFTMISGINNDSQRYSIYLTPAIALLASRGLLLYPDRSGPYLIRVWSGLLVMAITFNLYTSFKAEQPYVSGYKLVAEYVSGLPDQGTILFCCKHDGNFIFHVRRGDHSKNEVVLRADKILVSMSIRKQYGLQSYVETSNDLYRLLDRYGIGIIVAENRDLVGLSEFDLLLEVLGDSNRFELLQEFPLKTNVTEFADIKIRIYRYLDQKPIPDEGIIIPMPHLGRELHLPRNNVVQ